MAGVTGLEPAASGVTGRRSNQLSYTPSPSRPPKWLSGGDGREVLQAARGVKPIQLAHPLLTLDAIQFQLLESPAGAAGAPWHVLT